MIGEIGLKWSEKDDAKLAEMWGAGQSARQIAEILGVTRNAVIGRAHRLRGIAALRANTMGFIEAQKKRVWRPVKDRVTQAIAAEAVPSAPLRQPGPKPRHRRAAPQRSLRRSCEAVPAPTRPDGLLGIMELTASTCRWPSGDPKSADFGYCGKRVNGGTYCAEHWKRATVNSWKDYFAEPVFTADVK